MTELIGKDRRALRALGHHLRPVVQIGQHGISPAVVDATSEALAAHELVKVKVLEACPLDRHEAGKVLAEETGAELVQVLGRTCLLYRQRREEEGKKRAPPRAALHGHIGGEGSRPAARTPRRSITQGALGEGPPGRQRKPAKGRG